MQKDGAMAYKYWDFIEDGSFEWDGVDYEARIYFREIAAAFLRATFIPPSGYVIDVLEAKYVSYFPVVALGWNHEPESMALQEREALIRSYRDPLHSFIRAVDWQAIWLVRFREFEREIPSVVVKWIQ